MPQADNSSDQGGAVDIKTEMMAVTRVVQGTGRRGGGTLASFPSDMGISVIVVESPTVHIDIACVTVGAAINTGAETSLIPYSVYSAQLFRQVELLPTADFMNCVGLMDSRSLSSGVYHRHGTYC